ncbi:MAG TPA: two-component regulator propeller domain-containing protein, partial [Pyrinomonadaceae bacterium]|nr:two-component regulator propeller domain-containing protein [Pyrinomonadaceae bacterium]
MRERSCPQNELLRLVGRTLACLCLSVLAAALVRAERLPVRIYTTTDGLSSSAVNWLMRDSRGFLWFGTRDGLSRFDGQRFTTYRVAQGASPSITQILERRRGDYLAVTQSGSLYRFDAQTPATAASVAPSDDALTLHADLLADNISGLLYEDRAGRLWMTAYDGLFLLAESDQHATLQPVDLHLQRSPAEPAINVTRMLEARDGSLWLTTSLGLVRRTADGRTVLYTGPPATPMGNYLTGLCEDKDGRIWLGSRHGVYVLQPAPLSDPTAFTPRPLLSATHNPRPIALPKTSGDM